jgi:hypothetical protein
MLLADVPPLNAGCHEPEAVETAVRRREIAPQCCQLTGRLPSTAIPRHGAASRAPDAGSQPFWTLEPALRIHFDYGAQEGTFRLHRIIPRYDRVNLIP